jgi:hypothetical protein
MPRPNIGPYLTRLQKRGFTRAVWYLQWNEAGKKRQRSTGTESEVEAKIILADFRRERGWPPADDTLALYMNREAALSDDLSAAASGRREVMTPIGRIGSPEHPATIGNET